jgi:hypothetical protein
MLIGPIIGMLYTFLPLQSVDEFSHRRVARPGAGGRASGEERDETAALLFHRERFRPRYANIHTRYGSCDEHRLTGCGTDRLPHG